MQRAIKHYIKKRSKNIDNAEHPGESFINQYFDLIDDEINLVRKTEIKEKIMKIGLFDIDSKCNSLKNKDGVCSHLWGSDCNYKCCKLCSDMNCNSRCRFA